MKSNPRRLIPALLAAVLCFAVFCTIREDNGNAVNPGTDPNNGGGGGGSLQVTDTSGNPIIVVTPGEPVTDSSYYVGIRDTITLNVRVKADTTENAAGVRGVKVTVSMDPNANRWISATSLTTDNRGIATVQFAASRAGSTELTFKYGKLETKLHIEATDTPPRRMYISASAPAFTKNGVTYTINALVRNNLNNPVQNEEITFTSTAGVIDASAVTDDNGRASVTLRSENDMDDDADSAVVTAALAKDASSSKDIRLPLKSTDIPPTGQEEFTPGIKIFYLSDRTVQTGETVIMKVQLLADSADNNSGMKGDITVSLNNFLPGDLLNGEEVSVVTVTTGSDGWTAEPVTFSRKIELEATLTFSYGIGPTTLAQNHAHPNFNNNPSKNIIMNASPLIISADGASKSLITLQLWDEDNKNPIVGDSVWFRISRGWITAGGVTNSEGKVVAELSSEKYNDNNVVVTASYYKNASVRVREYKSIVVKFAGASVSTVVETRGNSTTIRATVRDGNGNPNADQDIFFVRPTRAGNACPVINEKCHATIPDSTYRTDQRGTAGVTVEKRGTSQRDTVIAVSAGVYDTVLIWYSNNNLTITGDKGNSYIAKNTETSAFTVKYANSNNNGIRGADIQVSVTAGGKNIFFAGEATTNNDGEIGFIFNNPNFTATATIFVKASTNNDVIEYTEDFYYTHDIVKRIEITGTPSVIGTYGNKAAITATAYDSEGNRVEGALIAFNFDKDSLDGGGGEYLYPPSAVTKGDGTATTELVSGDIPSFAQSVRVRASDQSGDVLSNTVRFTIVGPPKHITVRRNIGEIIAYPATYGKQLSVLVSDVNRNPVIDGTPVTFSANITGIVLYTLSPRFEVDKETMEYKAFIDTFPTAPRPSECVRKECTDTRTFATELINYRPFPRFDDINKNGVPDSGQFVEPCAPGGNHDVYENWVIAYDTTYDTSWTYSPPRLVETNTPVVIRRNIVKDTSWTYTTTFEDSIKHIRIRRTTGGSPRDTTIDNYGDTLVWKQVGTRYGLYAYYDGTEERVLYANGSHIIFPNYENDDLWDGDRYLADDNGPITGHIAVIRPKTDSTEVITEKYETIDHSGNALTWVSDGSGYTLYRNGVRVLNSVNNDPISRTNPDDGNLWDDDNYLVNTSTRVRIIGFIITTSTKIDSTRHITKTPGAEIGKINKPCEHGVWADYNGNGKRDSVECFIDRVTRLCIPDSTKNAHNLTYLYSGGLVDNIYSPAARLFWDLDMNWNGIPDPITTVNMVRTVLTKDGIADNEVIYGQSDGGRVEVTIWAEAQGVSTDSPERFVLPMAEGTGKYWNYFD